MAHEYELTAEPKGRVAPPTIRTGESNTEWGRNATGTPCSPPRPSHLCMDDLHVCHSEDGMLVASLVLQACLQLGSPRVLERLAYGLCPRTVAEDGQVDVPVRQVRFERHRPECDSCDLRCDQVQGGQEFRKWQG